MDINSSVYGFLKDVSNDPSISLIGLSVADKDKVLFEHKIKPYIKHEKQLVFSITKSITSLGIGILYDQGLIGLDDLIVKYFKDELPSNYDEKINEITIRHLLTMTSGIDSENIFDMLKSSDWRKLYFSTPFTSKPGTIYRYSSITTHMLSAIVSKVTNKPLEDLIKTHIFDVLNITNYAWEQAPEGTSFGGFGLSIGEDSLVKIGQLLLNDGKYLDKQIISKTYLDLATTPQAIKQDYLNNPNVLSIGFQYGFQFHVSPNLSYRADGAYGQVIVIYNGLAIITLAQYVDYDHLYYYIYKHFNELPVVTATKTMLYDYLGTLSFVKPYTGLKYIKDASYELPLNELDVKKISFNKDGFKFNYLDGKTDEFLFNYDQNTYGESHFIKDLRLKLQRHFVVPRWISEDALEVKVFYTQMPSVATYLFKFEKNHLEISFSASSHFIYRGFKIKSI